MCSAWALVADGVGAHGHGHAVGALEFFGLQADDGSLRWRSPSVGRGMDFGGPALTSPLDQHGGGLL